MKIKAIIFSLLTTLSINSIAQNIEVRIIGAREIAVLFELEGEMKFLVDSIEVDNGKFSINGDNYKLHTGFYRLSLSKNKWIDFIYDGDEVEIKTDAMNILDSLQVIKSLSNKLFYEFIQLNKEYKTKTELLQLILARYPKDDDYYLTTQQKLFELQEDYLEFVNPSSQNAPKSFIARYIKFAQLPVIDGTIPVEGQLDYLKSHSLEYVDFNDDEMIYSDLFTKKSIEYLTYYRNPQLPKALLEKEFMKAVDTLLTNAKINDIVYQHITNYLIDGFTKFGFDNIIDYIITNYVMVDDLCLNEETGNAVHNRVNQAKLMKVGENSKY